MQFELSVQELIGFVITLMGTFWGLARMLLSQTQKQITDQFSQITTHLNKQEEMDRRLEREVMELKAQLPREYVRREDYVQQVAMILTKLDAMQLRHENILLKTKGAQ